MSDNKIKNIFVDGAITAEFIAKSISNHNTKTEIGGHSIFLGQVRKDEVEGKLVSAIEYTAFEELVLTRMHEIRNDIFIKYPLSCLHVHHSLGVINAGEICLFVFTSSKHRKPAIEACNELVERIKSELPVWGKEIFTDTSHQWKENI
ncbi:MAG: molybdenum cofactor biosynthesis protein MoaE [Sphingobacteriales bacterium]|nr:MAG: molybdenum cofactor biosynthesis protein MoaE [Sphingobacteriales bacterium]